MRRGYSIYSFGLAAAGGKATEANMHDPYHNTKKQRADDDAQGAPTRRRQKKHKICISLEVMTQSEQPKMEENDRDEQKQKNEDATHRQKPRVQYSTSRKMEHEAPESQLQVADRPYEGEWSMACWNAQGLLASSAAK